MGTKFLKFSSVSVLIALTLILIGHLGFTLYAQAAPGDPIDVSSEADCQTANGVWDPDTSTCTEPPEDTTSTTSGSCEDSADEFGFILCPLLRWSNGAFEFFDGRIRQILEVNTDYLKDEANGDTSGVRLAWARIRNVAYALLIPIMLVMVIGTALGFSFLDAYTVKRALPRMIVAIIFMAISYDVCRILIEVTNSVGRGVGGLLSQPFGGASKLTIASIFEPGGGEQVGIGAALATTGVLAGIAVVAAGAISIGILASYLISAVLTLMVIFFTLTLRELLIIFLVIASPIAIIAWIFPGNDKLWKLWWGTFSKMLLLYPIVMAMIITGRGFAYIVNSATGSTDQGSLFTTLMKLTAYVGPYFFIPKAFKYAGGAFANIAGIVNDRGKGFIDRNKNMRKKMYGSARKDIGHRVTSGGKMIKGAPNGSIRGKLNTRATQSFLLYKAAMNNGVGSAMKKSTRTAAMDGARAQMDKAERDHILDDKSIAEWFGYDDLTGLSASVLSKDWGTLERVLRNKYKYDDVDFDDRMSKIKTAAANGELETALSEAFYMADSGKGDRAFNGDASFRNQSVQQVMAAQRHYGDEALSQALVLKTMAGGTFYQDVGDNWEAALASVTDHNGRVDRNALAEMAVKGRQMLQSTGRYDSGGASFGATLEHLGHLEKGMAAIKAGGTYDIDIGGVTHTARNENELRDIVGKSYVNRSIEQNGAAVFAHQSMKTGTLDMVNNAVSVFQDRLQRTHDIYGADSDEYKAEVANAEGLWKSLNQTKPEAAKIFGDAVLSWSAEKGRVLTSDEQQTEFKLYEEYRQYKASGTMPASRTYSNGEPIRIDTNGQLMPPGTSTRSEIGRLSSDPVYQNYSYQFTQAEQQLAQQAAAAAGAAAGGGPRLGPTPPAVGGPV